MKTTLFEINTSQTEGTCIDDEILAAFAECRLSDVESDFAAVHIASCPECRRRLAYAAIPQMPPEVTPSEGEVRSIDRLIPIRLDMSKDEEVSSSFERAVVITEGRMLSQSAMFRGSGGSILSRARSECRLNLGPYQLLLSTVSSERGAGLRVTLSRLDSPAAGVTAVFDLVGGGRIHGLTDSSGGLLLEGVQPVEVSAIRFDVPA